MTYTDLLDRAARILFFNGKGGVVSLVSTDPASNLDEVLGVELSELCDSW